MDGADLILLYDYYGDLLTDRQKECFELRYNQDLSLGEIGQELGISRQGVYDNLSRTEALLRNFHFNGLFRVSKTSLQAQSLSSLSKQEVPTSST